ncbi:MAG TPA: GC-type dockerin domain-anchored protein [Phycisphaerales bacterium]|nr:GC-type dockerin domain-anchored protein [Phycisphaerales bacterium]
MKINVFLLSTLVGLGGSSALAASVTPISASRELFVETLAIDSGTYSSGYDSDITSSNTLTPFDRKLGKFVKLGKQHGFANARQTSTITPNSLVASMTIDEYSLCISPGMVFSHSRGSINTTYRVDSLVRVKTTVTLANTAVNRGSSTASFKIAGPAGTLLNLSRAAAGQESYVGTAILEPGQYTFSSALDTVSQSLPSPNLSQSSSTLTLRCDFYCAADMDMSGFVDFNDFGVFVQAFEEGTEIADLDHSGFVDTDDFTIFAALFDNPC